MVWGMGSTWKRGRVSWGKGDFSLFGHLFWQGHVLHGLHHGLGLGLVLGEAHGVQLVEFLAEVGGLGDLATGLGNHMLPEKELRHCVGEGAAGKLEEKWSS